MEIHNFQSVRKRSETVVSRDDLRKIYKKAMRNDSKDAIYDEFHKNFIPSRQ